MTVGVDAQIMIWGVQAQGAKRGNPRQKNLREMQMRTAILLDMLQEKKETIIVPTVLVGELLAGIDPRDHGNFIAELQKQFFCPPYDLRAASVAGELWQYHKGLPKDPHAQRTVLKADVMIVATAKVAGATVFYSNDRRCRDFATKAGMTALDLPVNHEDMFADAEIKKKFGMST